MKLWHFISTGNTRLDFFSLAFFSYLVNAWDFGKRAPAGRGGPNIGTFLERVIATLKTQSVFS